MKKVVRYDVVKFDVNNDKGHFNTTFFAGVKSRKGFRHVKVELMAHMKDGSTRRLQTRGVDLGGLTFGTTRASYLASREDGTFYVKKDINVGIITEIVGRKLRVTLDTDNDNDAVAYTVTRLEVIK